MFVCNTVCVEIRLIMILCYRSVLEITMCCPCRYYGKLGWGQTSRCRYTETQWEW